MPFFSPTPDVALDITNRCRLSCRHCYNCSGGEPPIDLALDVVSRVLDELASFGQVFLQVSGGEPVLHPRFREIVLAAQARGLRVSLTTSGDLTESERELLCTLDLARVSVSLDGMRASNDAIRGSGAFDASVATIRALQSAGVSLMIASHLCKINRHDVEPLIRLAASLGLPIKFAPIRPVGRAASCLRDDLITSAGYQEVVSLVTRLREDVPGAAIRTDFDVLAPSLRSPTPPAPARAACPAGRLRLNVNSDGVVYPCSFFVTDDRRFAVGSVRERTLLDMWQNSPILSVFRTVDRTVHCGACLAFGQECVGGCLAMAYFATGSIHHRDPLCFSYGTSSVVDT
jgi:radical SAM protein with 4Fe4S-binding SPASM domain